MPELPEVEVVKRSLEGKISNLIIKNVKIRDGKLRYELNKEDINQIKGKKIIKIQRRSKFLIFEIGKIYRMLVHLGMTGKFFFTDNKDNKFKTSFYYLLDYEKDQKHDRVIFILNKKNPNIKLCRGFFKKYYLCFLVLNLPPLISFSKKEPNASPTSVNSTPVAPS